MNPHIAQPIVTAGAPLADCRAAAILIHGRGRTPNEMIALAAQFDLPDVAYIAPCAADQSWYPYSFLEPIARNQPQFDQALAAYHARISEVRAHRIPLERIALIGFSQGACLTSEYVMRNPARYGAVIAFTGGLSGPAGTTWEPRGSLDGTPLLICGAEADNWVPLWRMHESAELFAQMQAQVQTCFYPGDSHVVGADEIAAARRLLSALC